MTRDREDNKEIVADVLEKVSLLIAPFAPYISEFVYHNFGVALELALMRLEQTSNEAMKDLTYEEYEKIKTSEFPRAKRFLKALGYTVSVPIVSQTKDGATSATQTPVPATKS